MKFVTLGFVFAMLLPACTMVEGDRLRGRDMAAEHSAFAAVSPQADLGPAPGAGARRTLKYFELERLAKEHSVALSGDDSREACFERSTTFLNPEFLREALSESQLEILDFSRNPLPLGRPEFLPAGRSSSGLWRGRWLFGENRSMPIWVRVRGNTDYSAVRASRGPEIGRGDTVRVEVYSGGVLLTFDASAESSGHTGERVTVRNPANGQRFRAVVEAPGRVGIQK